MRVTTESGAVYRIDMGEGTWRREEGKSNARLRTGDGAFIWISCNLGKPMTLICPPFHRKAAARVIVTTPVTSIE